MKKAKIIKNGNVNLEHIEIPVDTKNDKEQERMIEVLRAKIERQNERHIEDTKLIDKIIESAVKDKNKIKKLKKALKALKAIVECFPEEVLRDQMNEDYDLIIRGLKK